MNLESPVIEQCILGMQAEGEGNPEEARRLFALAWEGASDDYEASIAAHYLARHQDSPELAYHWNQVALLRADAVANDLVREFYPSLYLNMGYSCEQIGEYAKAEEWYRKAEASSEGLPSGPYMEMLLKGIEAGLKRISEQMTG